MKIRSYLFGLCALTLGLQASPKGGTVVHGTASFKEDAGCLQVRAGDKAIIDWNHFGIQEGEIVQIIQDHKGSAVLNRDISGLRSDILGTLSSNGKVFLVNKAGIFIGKEAVINTGSFIGSSLDILNEEFIRGEELLFSNGDSGVIVQEGTIRCPQGEVYLIGQNVEQRGTIEASEIGIGVGPQVLLKPSGTERIYIRPQQSLTSEMPFHAYAIQQSGRLEATRTETREGRIFLVGDFVHAQGEMKAPEGEVRVLGQYLHVDGVIDVSGAKGGTILVGGDFQGKNPVIPNAKATVISEQSRLVASSTGSGDGGRVIIWSDYGTHFFGKIQAEGGLLGGDGGFVEVSGKLGLNYRGVTSTHAPNGKTGTLLMDPVDISIAVGSDNNIGLTPGMGFDTWSALACSSSTLTPTTLVASLLNNNIIVTTSFGLCQAGDITVVDPVIYSSPNSLTLNADNDIFVGAVIGNSGSGSITLNAGKDVNVGFLSVGSPATQQVYIGSLTGPVSVNAPAGAINVGNTAGGFPSQIGYGDPGVASLISGNITVQAQGDIFLRSSDVVPSVVTGAYAQIGHGAPTITTQGITGSITVKSFNGIVQLKSTALQDFGYTLIGHGGRDTGNTTAPISGNIQVESTLNSILVTAGASSTNGYNFAQIGHCGTGAFSNTQTVTGDILITCQKKGGTALTMSGGAGIGCYSQIGHGGDGFRFEQDVTGNFTFNIADGDVSLVSGNGEHAYTQIGHGGYSVTFDGSATGNINLPLTNGVFAMSAAQDPSLSANLIQNYVQIGHGGALTIQTASTGALSGNINVTSIQQITIQSADSEGNYAQVGHGGYSSQPNYIFGDIAVIGQSLNLQALLGTKGAGRGAYVQLGHGGSRIEPSLGTLLVGPNSGTLSGNITVNATSSINLNGNGIVNPTDNRDSPVLIGHGGAGMELSRPSLLAVGATLTNALLAGDISVTSANGDITLTGGNANDAGGAWIGHGPIESDNLTPTVISGNMIVGATQGSIYLTGGTTNAINITAVIGNGLNQSTSNTTFSGNESVTALKQITIQGGQGSACFASIYAPSGTQAVQSTTDSIFIKAGDGSDAHASIISSIGPQTITASQDVIAVGGTGGSITYARVYNDNLTPSSTTVTSQLGSVRFQNGNAITNPALLGWTSPGSPTISSIAVNAAKNIVVCYDFNVTGGVSSSLVFTADTDGDGLGSFAIDTATYDSIGNQILPSSYGVAFRSQGGPISFFGTDKFSNGAPADFMVGDSSDLSLLPLMPATIVSTSGNVTVNHFRNIYLTSGNQGGISTGTDVLLIADQNVQMTELPGNASQIKSKNVTIVVDNYFPTYPGIGTGFFSMTPKAIISGLAKIFSARQPLNSISGTLNGVGYVPGTQFVDTNTERWGVYYPNPFFGGPNYTIFYKDGFIIPPTPGGGGSTVVDVTPAIYQAQTGLSQMFFDLREIDDKFYWMSFLVSYDRARYLAQKEEYFGMSKWIDRLQVYQKAYFWKWLMRGMPKMDSLSSYEVDYDRENTLQPRVKGFIE